MIGGRPSEDGNRPSALDLYRARRIIECPDQHSDTTVRSAVALLIVHGDQFDLRRAMRIHSSANMDGADDDRLPIAWAIVFAFGIGAAAGVAGWLAWQILTAIDWQPILKFVAPTAFETRPIEVLIEGQRQ